MQGTETEFCDAWARRQHLSLTVTTNNRRKVKEREAGLPASPQEGPTAGGRRGSMIQQGQEEGVRLCAQCVLCTAHSPKHSHTDPWNIWQTSAPGTCHAASPAAPQWAATLCHILYAIALLMFHTVAALKVSTSQLSTSTASSQSPALCCGFPVPHTSSCFVWSQQRAFASCVPDQPPFLPRGGLLGAFWSEPGIWGPLDAYLLRQSTCNSYQPSLNQGQGWREA